jgi:prolipoprotein diacylglyceryltransferase
MQAQPAPSVVVYRSCGEQMRDEALWSEGFITATIAGDLCVVLLVIGVVAMVYQRLRFRRFFA